MGEIWKDVLGYEGVYQVSDSGHVKSLDRYVPNNKGKRFAKGKELRQQKDSSGYPYVHLCLNGIGKNKKVHRLVAEAFCTKRDGCSVVNHMDGCKDNNAANNLEWCTHQENIQHSIDTGTWKNIGENARDNVLKEFQVLEIRNNHTNSYSELAELYNVNRATIADIKKFRSWKQLSGEKLFNVTPEIKKSFPIKLKAIREKTGLNKGGFAETIGYERSTVDRWERGMSFPLDTTLRDLSKKLDYDFFEQEK